MSNFEVTIEAPLVFNVSIDETSEDTIPFTMEINQPPINMFTVTIGETAAGVGSGLPGPTGPRGPKGDTGATGAQGPAGADGVDGVDGINGTNGTNGAPGTAGSNGATGPAGAPGPAGDVVRSSISSINLGIGSKTLVYTVSSSNIGWGVGTRLRFFNSVSNYMEGTVTAVSSIQVTILADLFIGSGSFSSWTIAICGERGTAGADGINGINGTNGIDGAVGPQGPAGLDGAQGLPGADSTVPGPEGPQGPIGPNGGLNAYELAIENGFVGTLAEWFTSLEGAQGADSTVPGPQGEIGLTGPQGIQGIQGIQGEQGIQGIQGPIGDTGPQGLTGADSTVPGPQGLQGIQGETGPAGPQGIQGIQGETGLTGDTGPAGATGADSTVPGPTGPAGADGTLIRYGTVDPTTEGVDGDFYVNTTSHFIFGPKVSGTWPSGTSLVGPVGATGDTGPAGPTGADSTVPGPTGPAGDTGPQGDPGPTGAAGLNADMTRVSTTSNTIGDSGSKTFDYSSSSNLGWLVGTRIRASSGANYMSGVITAVSSTSVTFTADYAVGSGTFTSWNLSITGDDGVSGGSAGADGPSPDIFNYFNDCYSSTVDPITQVYTANNGSVIVTAWPFAGVPSGSGFLRIALSTNGGRAGYGMTNLAQGMYLRQGTTAFKVRTAIQNLSDGTNTYDLNIGFVDSVTATPSNGVYFRYNHAVNGGNWEAVCRTAGVETAVDTGSTAVATTMQVFLIEVDDSGTCVFKINGTIVATISTNVPPASTNLGPVVVGRKTLGSGATGVAILDYFHITQTFTTSRSS